MELNKTTPAPEKEMIKNRENRTYDAAAFNNTLKQNLETSQIDEYSLKQQ